jgi:hypothetical protein
MSTRLTSFVVASLLAVTAACGGGSPTGPSAAGGAGATIAGTVNRSGSAAMTVAVAGTGVSAAVDSTGAFQVTDVPTGNVQLQFREGAVSASAQVSNVGREELIQIEVQMSGSSATIVNEVRTSGKVELCHATGNGTYQKIEVSVSAEPAHRAHGDAKVGEPVPGDTAKTFDSSCRPTGGASPTPTPAPTPGAGHKVQLCHRTGNGSYHLIDVEVDAEPAHRAHGDAKVGEAVPGQAGKTFATDCSIH